jgi:hypothetical protein
MQDALKRLERVPRVVFPILTRTRRVRLAPRFFDFSIGFYGDFAARKRRSSTRGPVEISRCD